jgi:serine phosphatase RsbU (regulator of sigma subunit)
VGDIGEDTVFCTAIFGILQIGDEVTAQLVTGGHPAPLLRGSDGAVTEVALRGSLLGVLPTVTVPQERVVLEPGSSLVLFTDGLLEARGEDGAFFEADRVRDVVAAETGGATAIVRRLERALFDHTRGTLEDDVAVVAIHVT